MKLFSICTACRQKIYLASNAKSRRELAESWGALFTISCPKCRTFCQLHVNAVKAEGASLLAMVVSTLGGGAIGIVAGPIGVGIGLIVGGAGGRYLNRGEIALADNFNNSSL